MPYLENKLDLVRTEQLEEGEDAERRPELSRDAVVHDSELSVRRYKGEGASGLKLIEVDTFVEVAVVNGDDTIAT